MKQAEQLVVAENMDKEYAAITGVADFRRLAAELAYSPSSAPLQDKRVSCGYSAADTISRLTGACRWQRLKP
jgi:aspartate aminotransferase